MPSFVLYLRDPPLLCEDEDDHTHECRKMTILVELNMAVDLLLFSSSLAGGE